MVRNCVAMFGSYIWPMTKQPSGKALEATRVELRKTKKSDTEGLPNSSCIAINCMQLGRGACRVLCSDGSRPPFLSQELA
mmetsp:Transcript_123680/g.276306  ORF Transcript_123680/g.276306 Transcript_123680/m.276306 type:complete len:80 (-) Transcript_123680:3-242(-)